MFFKNIYKEYKELKQENEYYTRECYLKEERIRELKKRVKELESLTQKPKRGRPRKDGK